VSAGSNHHPRDDESRDPAIERALSFASRPTADPAFRSRLRERFLDVGGTVQPRRVPVRPRKNVFPLVWPAVLAASVALVIVFVLSNDQQIRWRVLDPVQQPNYVVDGYAIDATQGKRMNDLLQTAHDIETKEQGLRLQLADQLVLDLAPRTHVSQLTFPSAGAYSLHVDSGSARIVTGPGFGGLRVTTDDMKAEVTGTAFAVDIVHTGTCLCCLHGTVKCDVNDKTGAHPVGDSSRGFAYHDGKPAQWSTAEEVHLAPVRDIEASIQRNGWGR
jgi:hypothetical protein